MVNWPVLTNFCGCCSLSTGIYFVGIIQVIGNIIVAYYDVTYLISILEPKQKVFGYVIPELEARANIDDEQNKVAFPLAQEESMFLMQIYRMLLTHHIVWFVCRSAILVSIGALFYGLHKSNPVFIKSFLYLNFPGWFLITLHLAVEMVTYSWMEKIMGVIFVLASGYQLLLVRSAYRLLSGKSRFHIEDDNSTELSYPSTNASSNPPPYNARFDMTLHNNTHCSTCSCDRTPSQEETRQTAQEESIVFGQNQLVRPNAVLEVQGGSLDTGASGTNADNSIARRPTSLALVNGNDCRRNEIEKKEVEDAPVIYDEAQLNVGLSPIIETR